MNKIFTLLLLTAINLSCSKNETYPGYIKAGQISGPGISYTDVDPDFTITMPDIYTVFMTKSIDLNEDKTPDFILQYSESSVTQLGMHLKMLEIVPQGMNAVCISNEHGNWVDSLNFNDTISAKCNWSDSLALLYRFYWYVGIGSDSTGLWRQNSNFYIGVKIVDGGHTQYGWMDMKLNTLRQFAVTRPY
jgi:hypothetical protein